MSRCSIPHLASDHNDAFHVTNCAEQPAYREGDPSAVAFVELGSVRTLLAERMIKEERAIGLIAIYRQEVRPFSDKQVALMQHFADQAVIAIENARLLNELRQRTDDLSQRTTDLTEALEQQTATSEVLQIISSSPGDLEPAFATMLENAVASATPTSEISTAGTATPYTLSPRAIHHLPLPKRVGIHSRTVPVRKLLPVVCWRPKRLSTSCMLRQNLDTVTRAI